MNLCSFRSLLLFKNCSPTDQEGVFRKTAIFTHWFLYAPVSSDLCAEMCDKVSGPSSQNGGGKINLNLSLAVGPVGKVTTSVPLLLLFKNRSAGGLLSWVVVLNC